MTEQHEVLEKELENALNQLSETVNKILTETFSFKGKTENKKYWDMDCPYQYGDYYWFISDDGIVVRSNWFCHKADMNRFYSGNTFSTEQSAKLEAERRRLLTLFNAFRDECNDGWEPDFNDHNSKKWVIAKNEEGMYAMWTVGLNAFSYFGCFKNRFDTERAIELFGDEIKKLFIDCECD
ncbi:hypothetical protein [Granulicatella adiacens]|uniref:hypothetical protein n=1 Tax=Granulicatella adiacens TaxID=46124 RepID=UPI003C6FCB83